MECSDAIICSDSESPQLQIAVHHGSVVDAIEVNGRRFGTQDGPPNKENVDIQHGERVQKMRYGIGKKTGEQWNNAICGLYLITNVNTFGPFGPLLGYAWLGYACEAEYTVNIPDKMTLHEFLQLEMTLTDENWPSGFRNQIPV